MSKKQKSPDVYQPYPIVLLAIDPGKTSGAALFCDGQLEYHGQVDSFSKMQDAAGRAANWADKAWGSTRPLLVVIEKHTPHGRWGPQQFAGCAESVGLWKQAIRELPRRKPTTKVVRVNVFTWRSKMIGRADRIHDIDTNEVDWKLTAVSVVKRVYQIETDHNTAEAILIGRWASVSGRIGDVLPKAVREGVVGL